MKVKIGDVFYDSKEQPIMVVLSVAEKNLISMMREADHRFACFPNDSNRAKIEKWMKKESHESS